MKTDCYGGRCFPIGQWHLKFDVDDFPTNNCRCLTPPRNFARAATLTTQLTVYVASLPASTRSVA